MRSACLSCPSASPETETMTIRTESAQDYAAIRQLHRAAFGGDEEARLVDALRDGGGLTVSLVAEEQGQIVGHIALSPMQQRNGPATALGLGPMAVVPGRQKQGIGSALVNAALEAARGEGTHAIFVLGHPDYYPRFGFIPAHEKGIQSTYDVPAEAFMVLELQPGTLDDSSGVVHYHEAFDNLGA